MIDRVALLNTLKAEVARLEASIDQRIAETPAIAERLRLEHHRAEVAGRTAMSLEEWQGSEVTQAAVAWVLACVFVRFLEDNRLVDEPLITGPGQRGEAALGHRSNYFQYQPGHSDREYLESAFHEIARYAAVAPLYDERHNPLWRLGTTADGARELRETFAAIDPATGDLVHDFTDPGLDTRFLGDLYQDLSEAARERYALLQTPDFVESFILDRTLTPAINEFGLDEVALIDPTCGSGHFLIGAFHRLFALWKEHEPGTTATVLAQRALDQIAGVDLNPYATAIARFRLVIAALKACGITRLAEAPAFALNLATGDSLLHGPLPFDGAGALSDTGRLDKNIAHVYESEDAHELKRILGRGYHSVVGNPPYITGDDEAVRAAYRVRYVTCHREFALTAPFMERFFELAQLATSGRSRGGFVGQITGNAFMKREFGSVLVEQFLPTVDVQLIVDSSGVHLPGHGTPTVMVFGRGRPPASHTIRVVDGLRGEAARPAVPSEAPVWRAVRSNVDSPGVESDYVRVADVDRAELAVHPMVIGAGRLVKQEVERRAVRSLNEVADDFGYSGQTNIDDLMLRPADAWRRSVVPRDHLREFITGHDVRDWRASSDVEAWFPYARGTLVKFADTDTVLHALWPWRTSAWARRTFGKRSYREEGRAWWEWHQLSTRRDASRLAVTWASVVTHNHFAFTDQGQAFNRHAPVIKLSPTAQADEYMPLLEVLNSSVAAAWFRQVCHSRGAGGVNEGFRGDEWECFIEISVSRVERFPLPPLQGIGLYAAKLHAVAPATDLNTIEKTASLSLRQQIQMACDEIDWALARMVTLQEEADWAVLASYGFVDRALVFGADAPAIVPGQRAFEMSMARGNDPPYDGSTWFARHGIAPASDPPAHWPSEYRAVVEARIRAISNDVNVRFVERPEHKRRWNRAPREGRVREALTKLVLDALETPELWEELRPRSTADLTDHLRKTPLLVEALEILAGDRDADLGKTVAELVTAAAVPHLAAQRLEESGLRKRAVWEQVWELQRAEDRGEDPGRIAVPPKYARADFTSATWWKHRGKLDVSKERFVLVPNAQRGADASPVVGWAGWDELALARALAGRITELRNEEAANAERVTSLLSGVLELLPWIHQWHPDPDPAYNGQPPGTFLEGWLNGQLSELAVTRETLRAWRPPTPTRGRRRATS